MKISTINTNHYKKNITCQAHFKPNTEFKKIWTLSEKTESVKNKLHRFSTLEPHELEIIESGKAFKDTTDYSIVDYYAIFNNFTKKALTFNIPIEINKNPLDTLLDIVLANNYKTKDFFKKDENSDIFEKCTTPKR